jgi:hypothetical protein
VRPDSPAPVRRAGPAAKVYESSLSIALFGMFALSFVLHLLGGTAAYNEEQAMHGQAPVTAVQFLAEPQFWFQSMQNWQSEFVAVAAVVGLSILLRQRGSPESKPVADSHRETGGPA